MKYYLPTDFSDEKLKFVAQIGVDGVYGAPEPGPTDLGFYDFHHMVALKSKVESYGLKYYSIRLGPWAWVYKWMLGLPGKDEQLENLMKTIRNMGAAGIPIFTYNMHVLRYYRTSQDEPGRAGTRATSFNFEKVRSAPLMSTGPGADSNLIPEEHRKPVTDDQMWANLEYMLKAIVPVAEKAGVRLALHPDDPPIPQIAGVARIMRSPEAYRRLMKIDKSETNGMHFCQGCFTEMGADIPAEIRFFGKQNRIVAIDFRNVIGDVNNFREAFPDEGQADMAAAMEAYLDAGVEGPMCPDHAIHMDGDTAWGHRYWAYAIGHMKGLEQALRHKSKARAAAKK